MKKIQISKSWLWRWKIEVLYQFNWDFVSLKSSVVSKQRLMDNQSKCDIPAIDWSLTRISKFIYFFLNSLSNYKKFFTLLKIYVSSYIPSASIYVSQPVLCSALLFFVNESTMTWCNKFLMLHPVNN